MTLSPQPSERTTVVVDGVGTFTKIAPHEWHDHGNAPGGFLPTKYNLLLDRIAALETALADKQQEVDDACASESAKVSMRDMRIIAQDKELAALRARLAAVEKVEKWLTREVEDGYVRARLSNDGGFVARAYNEYTRDETVAIAPTLAELGEKLP